MTTCTCTCMIYWSKRWDNIAMFGTCKWYQIPIHFRTVISTHPNICLNADSQLGKAGKSFALGFSYWKPIDSRKFTQAKCGEQIWKMDIGNSNFYWFQNWKTSSLMPWFAPTTRMFLQLGLVRTHIVIPVMASLGLDVVPKETTQHILM